MTKRTLIVANWKMAASPLIGTFGINPNLPAANRACSPQAHVNKVNST